MSGKIAAFLAKHKGKKTFKVTSEDPPAFESLRKTADTTLNQKEEEKNVEQNPSNNEFSEWVDPHEEEGVVGGALVGHLKLSAATQAEAKPEAKPKEAKTWNRQIPASLSVPVVQETPLIPVKVAEETPETTEVSEPAEEPPAAATETKSAESAEDNAPKNVYVPRHKRSPQDRGDHIQHSRKPAGAPLNVQDSTQFPDLGGGVTEAKPAPATAARKKNAKRERKVSAENEKELKKEKEVETENEKEEAPQQRFESLMSFLIAGLSDLPKRPFVKLDVEGSITKFRNKRKLDKKELPACELVVSA